MEFLVSWFWLWSWSSTNLVAVAVRAAEAPADRRSWSRGPSPSCCRTSAATFSSRQPRPDPIGWKRKHFSKNLSLNFFGFHEKSKLEWNWKRKRSIQAQTDKRNAKNMIGSFIFCCSFRKNDSLRICFSLESFAVVVVDVVARVRFGTKLIELVRLRRETE